jgi:hypothetical protein
MDGQGLLGLLWTVPAADPDHDRRERASGIRFIVALLLAGIAAVAAGVISTRPPVFRHLTMQVTGP